MTYPQKEYKSLWSCKILLRGESVNVIHPMIVFMIFEIKFCPVEGDSIAGKLLLSLPKLRLPL